MLQATVLDNKSGMDPKTQLKAIYKAVAPLYDTRDRYLSVINETLEVYGNEKINIAELEGKEKKFVSQYFVNQVQPILSPQIVSAHHPFPHLENMSLHISLMLKSKDAVQYGLIPVPRTLKRVVILPGKRIRYMLMEELILHFAKDVIEMYEILEKAVICVTSECR